MFCKFASSLIIKITTIMKISNVADLSLKIERIIELDDQNKKKRREVNFLREIVDALSKP